MHLTHWVPVLPSYTIKSIDLHSKSIDWFPYEGNTGTYWVKYVNSKSNYVEITNYQVNFMVAEGVFLVRGVQEGFHHLL